MIESEPARGRYWVLALVCLLSMITYLDRACFGVAGPTLASELGLSGVSDLYWPFTAFTIAYALFEVPSGWLGDRLGPKKTLIRIVLWWSGFTALTGLAGLQFGPVVFGLGALVVVRFLFGAGEAGAYPNITRAIHNWFPANQWAMAQGCVWMSGRLMGGLTPLLWTLLVSGTAWSAAIVCWRTAFMIFGLIGVSWCLVFAATFRNGPNGGNSVVHTEAPHETPWRAMLRSGNLWTLCFMYFCVNYGWYFHITYLVGYMKDRYGLDDQSLLGAMYKGGAALGGCGWVLSWRCGLGLADQPAGRSGICKEGPGDRLPVGLRDLLVAGGPCAESIGVFRGHIRRGVFLRFDTGLGVGDVPGHWSQVAGGRGGLHEHDRGAWRGFRELVDGRDCRLVTGAAS